MADHAEHFDPACEECAYLARPTRETLGLGAEERLRAALRKWLFPRGFDHPGHWSLTNEGAKAIAAAAAALEGERRPKPGMGVWLVTVVTIHADGSLGRDVSVVVAATETSARRRAIASHSKQYKYRVSAVERVDITKPEVVMTGEPHKTWPERGPFAAKRWPKR